MMLFRAIFTVVISCHKTMILYAFFFFSLLAHNVNANTVIISGEVTERETLDDVVIEQGGKLILQGMSLGKIDVLRGGTLEVFGMTNQPIINEGGTVKIYGKAGMVIHNGGVTEIYGIVDHLRGKRSGSYGELIVADTALILNNSLVFAADNSGASDELDSLDIVEEGDSEINVNDLVVITPAFSKLIDSNSTVAPDTSENGEQRADFEKVYPPKKRKKRKR